MYLHSQYFNKYAQKTRYRPTIERCPLTRIINDDSEVVVLWLVQTAAQAIMWLATLVTPVVVGKKYLPLNPVAGTMNQE
jgi:hypothetical protein